MLFGIFIYPGVEPVDLATFGVLSMARRVAPEIEIVTIAPQAGQVTLSNGLKVVADYGIADAPDCAVVIVTGGPGWVAQAQSPDTLAYMNQVAARGKLASVCTGAMILAASGVLDGQTATTKRRVVPPEVSPLDIMRQTYPAISVAETSLAGRGAVITSGGVSLCIDATLHLIAALIGESVANETARLIEYDRAWAVNLAEFPPLV